MAVVIFIIGFVLQTAAVDYAMSMTARQIGGGGGGGGWRISVGMLSMVALLYISEASPPEVRGTPVVLEEFSIASGITVTFWATYGARFIQGDCHGGRLSCCRWYLLSFWARTPFPTLFASLVDVERQVWRGAAKSVEITTITSKRSAGKAGTS